MSLTMERVAGEHMPPVFRSLLLVLMQLGLMALAKLLMPWHLTSIALEFGDAPKSTSLKDGDRTLASPVTRSYSLFADRQLCSCVLFD